MKKSVRMLLFLTLIMLKVSAATVYFHDCEDDDEPTDECVLCDEAIHNQNTEFSSPPEFQSFEIDAELFLYEPKIHFERVYRNMPCDNRYFGRPPPTF